MNYQPDLPMNDLSTQRGTALQQPPRRQISPANAVLMLQHLKRDLSVQRDTVERYLNLYQQKATSHGSSAIVNALAFAVSDYNGTIRDLYAPLFPPAQSLFAWENIYFNLHLMAAGEETEPMVLPELPNDMELMQYLQRR